MSERTKQHEQHQHGSTQLAQKEQRFSFILHPGVISIRHNYFVAVFAANYTTWLSRWPHRHTLDHRFVLEKERKRENVLACDLCLFRGWDSSSHQ